MEKPASDPLRELIIIFRGLLQFKEIEVKIQIQPPQPYA